MEPGRGFLVSWTFKASLLRPPSGAGTRVRWLRCEKMEYGVPL